MTTTTLATAVFWASFAILLYTFVGYPILVALWSRIWPRSIHSRVPDEGQWPFVSMIIAARNEEMGLPAKFRNIAELDYPRNKLEVIIVSDASTDGTDALVECFVQEMAASLQVRLLRQVDRLGKTAAQNAAVEMSLGEIILFSDATTLYQPNVLRVIVPNFADPSIGCVAGRLIYVDPSSSNVGAGARSYWEYETFLKRCESRIGSLIGTSGCLYAVRRSNYIPLPHEAGSDFVIASVMMEQMVRTIYETDALCTEETNRRVQPEFQMRVRVMVQTYNDLWRHRAMLNPFRSGFYAIQLFSHKVLRYLLPALLLLLFAATIPLASQSVFYKFFLILQLIFCFLAAAGWLLEKMGMRFKLFALPHYFALTSMALIVAFFKFLGGERYQRWETVREPQPES